MARSTIAEDITRLEASLTSIRVQIEKHQSFRRLEEGSASSRFTTEFTDITKLYEQEHAISARLETLYNYKVVL